MLISTSFLINFGLKRFTPALVCRPDMCAAYRQPAMSNGHKKIEVSSATMAGYITEYPHFFTATNLEWKKLLLPDEQKDLIIESMRFLVKDKSVIIYDFVIMQNHIHIIWQMQAGRKRDDVQRDFLKHTAQKIKDNLLKKKSQELKDYLVNAKDRKYQFWEELHCPLRSGLKKFYYKN